MWPAAPYAADGMAAADVADSVAVASLVSSATLGRQIAVEQQSQRHAAGPESSHSVGYRLLAS